MNTMITDAELPELPKARFVTDRHSGTSFVSYTAEQMGDYARAAMATVKQSLTAAPEAGVTRAAVEAELEKVGAQQKKQSLWIVTTRELVTVVDALTAQKPGAGNPVSVEDGRYQRLFLNAVEMLTAISLRLGIEENEEGVEPILEAIDALAAASRDKQQS